MASPEAFLLDDDSGQDKRYSKFIDVARRQCPGAVQGMVPGIGLVNLVHSNGPAGGLLPPDYLVCAPEDAQQTRNDHFLALFDHVVEGTQARPLLFDGWYAGSPHLRHIHRAGRTFCTTLKSNRRVSVPEETGYPALDTLEPPERGWSAGVEVRRKEVPFAVKLFQLVTTSGDID